MYVFAEKEEWRMRRKDPEGGAAGVTTISVATLLKLWKQTAGKNFPQIVKKLKWITNHYDSKTLIMRFLSLFLILWGLLWHPHLLGHEFQLDGCPIILDSVACILYVTWIAETSFVNKFLIIPKIVKILYDIAVCFNKFD